MLPITEQRLSIPYFIIYEEFLWHHVVPISILGNILIGIVIYLIISPILMQLSKIKMLKYLINLIINNASKRIKKIKNKNKLLGLILFIGIPLPFTGVWTGALGGYLLNLKKRDMIIGIILGVLLSAIIVGSLTLLGNEIWISFIKDSINKKLGFK